MAETTLVVLFVVLFWTWPILLGLFVWLSKASFAVVYIDRLEIWLATTRERLRSSTGRVARYWARPTISLAHLPFAATEAIPNPLLRAGARVAIAPYVAGLICAGTLMALELAIVVGFFFLIFMTWGLLSNFSSNDGRGAAGTAIAQALARVRGTRLMKTGFWGSSPTGARIDGAGRIMQEGALVDTPSGLRVAEDGRVMKEGLLADSPTGLRVNAEGQLVKEDFLVDSPTGTKIDKDGRVVEWS